MIQYIRWQAFIALSGILLLLTLLNHFSDQLAIVVEPEVGGTYTEAIIGEPSNLNPLFLNRRADRDVAALLFNSLTRVDESSFLQPDLARRWEIDEDGKQYTFYLRDDVLWHDGEPFTTEDVAFTISVLQDPAYTRDSALSQMWRSVTVEVVDPYTIRFTLPDDLAPFGPFLSFTTVGILPSHLLADVPVEELASVSFSRYPIGTGPWRVERVDAGEIVLEPHPAYHGPAPKLDHLVLRFYESTRAALQAYRLGEVMGVARIQPEELGQVLSDPSLNPHPTTMAGYTALFFNLQHSLFQQRSLRQSLISGLDRRALIDEVLNGQGIVAHGFLMPTHWAYDSDLPRYPYEPEEAAALLDQLGWFDSDSDGIRDQDGLPLDFSILVYDGEPRLVAMAEAVARQWRTLGVQAETEVVSSEALREALRERSFDVVLLSTPQGSMPVDPDFYPLWHSSQTDAAGLNYTSFSDEEADALLVEARHTLEIERRRELYHQFQEILARELPALPLYHPIYNYAVSNQVRNVQIGPLHQAADRFKSLPEWTVRTQRRLIETSPTPIATQVP